MAFLFVYDLHTNGQVLKRRRNFSGTGEWVRHRGIRWPLYKILKSTWTCQGNCKFVVSLITTWYACRSAGSWCTDNQCIITALVQKRASGYPMARFTIHKQFLNFVGLGLVCPILKKPFQKMLGKAIMQSKNWFCNKMFNPVLGFLPRKNHSIPKKYWLNLHRNFTASVQQRFHAWLYKPHENLVVVSSANRHLYRLSRFFQYPSF